jgi:hypothetical protein
MKKYIRSHLDIFVIALVALPLFAVAAWAEVHKLDLESVSQAGGSSAPTTFSLISTGSDTSQWIDLSSYTHFSYQSKCTSAGGTADYQLVIEVASDMDTNKLGTLSTEFTSDSTEDWTAVTSFFPPPSGAARFSMSGVASNPVDTLCWIIVNRARRNR